MGQDGLAVIMEWAFDYMQRAGEGDPVNTPGCAITVYLRLTTKPLEQPGKGVDDAFCQGDRRCQLAAQARAELFGCGRPVLRRPGREAGTGCRAFSGAGSRFRMQGPAILKSLLLDWPF